MKTQEISTFLFSIIMAVIAQPESSISQQINQEPILSSEPDHYRQLQARNLPIRVLFDFSRNKFVNFLS